ncbi:HAD family hydrolase [Solemya velesiana gill symbiont]|uniref:Histidinol-phosphatase n=1 Tax=Solemya velesiana gill symbiont TaxID=1918948 RepID=A0A1T2KVP7_9GAMM|nr:HAD family hydrolase [Solemya velesiana gill symbiont]OOZ36927.1 phosphoserine phosphatase [Solemya velesiana gill symbiont]
MALAIFDLDNTLLAGDSDYLWGIFLAEQGVVDGEYYQRENERFYHDYNEGRLDIFEFLRFSLKPLSEHSLEALQDWREKFLEEMIEPIILPKAQELVSRHREAGDTLMIITATNAFVTSPIAQRLGIENLIATDPKMVDGRYTGEVSGTPSFKNGKVERLEQWLEATGADLSGSSFYSDSHNDIPLLERVDKPVAVDPDEALTHHAKSLDWPIITLRE